MKQSPTSRTLEYLRGLGAEVVVLEHWHHYAKRRMDKWGADILARQGRLLMAIQATSHTNHSARVEKSKGNKLILNWLIGGVPFYIYSWGLQGARGKRKGYTLRVTQLVTDDGDTIKEL